ncbi:multidrug resistance protein [Azorhizobium oxalatiphilum]|uniref:Multidrug resistance protein n=1 Tax=Azorhizobium oxalatiphilum TaxID=980631 RepID=A0A917BRB6_9HYPH|nr:HlyD family secretion protein [Azorhizobium oxalatiphilum]GGF51585.1 multidrug resistance protein [Azorhizobium oxalatiphilum]
MSIVTELPPPAALAPPAPTAPPAVSGAASLRRLLLPAAAIVTALGMLAFTDARWDQWVAAQTQQYTDDAYVRADVSTLSARVSGNVLKMLVNDYQQVKAGQPLVEIDPADYKAAADAAQAAVAAAQAALANLKNQQNLQQAVVSEAEAQLAAVQAAQVQAKQEFDRQQALVNGGIAGTVQKLQQATAAQGKADADVRQAAAAIEAQKRQLAVLAGQEGTLAANVEAAQANLETARLKLGYTTVNAPFDGQVSTRLVQAADYVNVGTSLISVVPVPNVYVMANYKETQLTHVVPGQAVDMTVDTFPGEVLHGHVARVAPASGAVFALLPPDNATGNFTKVVQRIPVRIAVDPGQPLTQRLRAGMSVETRIHVGEGDDRNIFGRVDTPAVATTAN